MKDYGKPYISIIVPAFNASRFIRNAIESVLKQPFENIELIVIDDGSSDDTYSICKQFEDIDKRLLVYSIDNSGAGAARNFGIKKARGTWVMFLDSDDVYLSSAIDEFFICRLQKYEERTIDIIYTSTAYSDIDLKKRVDIKYEKNAVDIIPETAFWGAIYSRQYLDTNNISFYEIRKQDIESAFRFVARNNTDRYVVDNELLFYLQRNNQYSNTHTWNLQNLHEVKCIVYYDLAKKYANNKVTFEKLFMISMHHLDMYYQECIIAKAVEEKEAIKKMNAILNDVRKYYMSELLRLIGNRWVIRTFKNSWLVEHTLSEREKAVNISLDNTNAIDNSDIINKRMDLLSEYLLNAVRT